MSKLYVTSVGAVIVTVPVATSQVGCTTVMVGAGGVTGWVFITADVAADTHSSEFFTETLYVPAGNEPLVLKGWKLSPPLKLYVTSLGADTEIVPVATRQVVWVTDTVGATGVTSCRLTTTETASDSQPSGVLVFNK